MSEHRPTCPKCGITGDGYLNSDFIFKCLCGFKGRQTLECPVCQGDVVNTKDGYLCLSSGCGLKFWSPTETCTEEDFKVIFGEGWNKIAYHPDESLCFLCNSPILKQGDVSKCQNKLCDIFDQKVYVYRTSDACCNPAGVVKETKDGGKKLLDQVAGLVNRSSRKLLYETPHERYRNTTALLQMLSYLKQRPPENLNEALDNIIHYVKAASPFYPETFKAPKLPEQ